MKARRMQVKIGKRSIKKLWYAFSMPANYFALWNFPKVHESPLRRFKEEFFSSGIYPRTLRLKTPTGQLEVRLFTYADLSTLNLIFCRQDYYVPDSCRVVVDIGANIGLSCLFWLSRNLNAFVYGYEPVPLTFARLVENLRQFDGRFELFEQAVSDFRDRVTMGVSKCGVYSAIGYESEEQVEVECIHIMDVLEPVLERHDKIDVLKLDNEGHELQVLAAIEKSAWKRIRCVNVDAKGATAYVPKDFICHHLGSADRFYRI